MKTYDANRENLAKKHREGHLAILDGEEGLVRVVQTFLEGKNKGKLVTLADVDRAAATATAAASGVVVGSSSPTKTASSAGQGT